MIRARVIGRRFHSRRGLSLGEMLVVLAVFLILAAIFFISSRGVIVKTNVSKARHEMREIDSALNIYHATYSKFPTAAQGVKELVGPQKSLSREPQDPFEESSGGYQYFPIQIDQAGDSAWVLVSVGPDGRGDFDPNEHLALLSGALHASPGGDPKEVSPFDAFRAKIADLTYDPTNGVGSAGDIFRFHQDFGIGPR